MKIKEMNLSNVEIASHTSQRNRGSLGRLARVRAVVMKPQFYIAGLFATGYLALTPTQAAGAPAGHMSAALSHGNDHYRYSAFYGGSSYFSYAGVYDSDYSYTPTPEQQATAKQQVEEYLAAVKKVRKRAATHRYISVETLRPTKTQLEDYLQKQRPPRTGEPSQLRCLMVFDTQTRQFVGSGCYVVQGEPSIGGVKRFEAVSAEFVGQGNL
jgi:hypothetical protein